MALWKVTHSNIGFVEQGEVGARDLDIQIGLNQANQVGYTINTSEQLATKEFTEPYATDFTVYRGSTKIIAGMHTNVQGGLTEHDLKVSGLSYEHYLDRIIWPFDPSNITQFRFIRTNTDVTVIIKDMLDTIFTSYTDELVMTYTNNPVGIVMNFRIDLADTETIFSKIQTLSQAAPGFDFWITPDRALRIVPKRDNTPAFQLVEGINLVDLTYDNSGPDGNVVLGIGQTAASKVGKVLSSPTSKTKYRRMEISKDFGTVANQAAVDALTQAELDRASTPVKRITAKTYVEPDDVCYGDLVNVGDTIRVQGTISDGYDDIDDYYRITTAHISVSDVGDEVIEFGFNEVQAGA